MKFPKVALTIERLIKEATKITIHTGEKTKDPNTVDFITIFESRFSRR